MVIDTANEAFKLAFHYVNDTHRHVYLTGKAGTGKTTFLKHLKTTTTKTMVVVAPTGVAAINAGGVTMHSFFQLPLKPFVAYAPQGFGRNERIADRNSLLSNLRINNNKRKLINELDLIVMDEVSMLRSDHLEAINIVLKHIRKNPKPFGGIQMLFIGDMYQLPPVVVDQEREIIESNYKSPYFFDAPIMQEIEPLYIELKTVYRQKEIEFIDLLNRVRNNQMNPEDYHRLNERYNPDFEAADHNYITITSHNHKADTINREELAKLEDKPFRYHALVDGDFHERLMPTDEVIMLKEGAQIMFNRNDSTEEKKYFNGKLAKVVGLTEKEIRVEFTDNQEEFILRKETWENINYVFNPESQVVEEKIVGTFTQYPIKLAWAITIHKSQGLTFERAIIDAGSSFAPGQVYVALSRCTNLDGMVLKSRILPGAILSDDRIATFAQQETGLSGLKDSLERDILDYQHEKLRSLFNWDTFCLACQEAYQEGVSNKSISKEEEIIQALKLIFEKSLEQKTVVNKFSMELESLMNAVQVTGNAEPILKRCEKAIDYFSKQIYDDLIGNVQVVFKKLNTLTGVKTYAKELKEFESLLWAKIESLHQAQYRGQRICAQAEITMTRQVSGKPKKREKGASAKETLAYYMSGKRIPEIAQIKHIAESTVEGHLAIFVESGDLDIRLFLDEEQLEEIKHALPAEPPYGLNELRSHTGNNYSFGILKMAIAHFIRLGVIPPMKPIKDSVRSN